MSYEAPYRDTRKPFLLANPVVFPLNFSTSRASLIPSFIATCPPLGIFTAFHRNSGMETFELPTLKQLMDDSPLRLVDSIYRSGFCAAAFTDGDCDISHVLLVCDEVTLCIIAYEFAGNPKTPSCHLQVRDIVLEGAPTGIATRGNTVAVALRSFSSPMGAIRLYERSGPLDTLTVFGPLSTLREIPLLGAGPITFSTNGKSLFAWQSCERALVNVDAVSGHVSPTLMRQVRGSFAAQVAPDQWMACSSAGPQHHLVDVGDPGVKFAWEFDGPAPRQPHVSYHWFGFVYYAHPDDVCMARMSPVRVAWMSAVARCFRP